MTQLEKMLLMQSIQRNPGFKAASMVDPTMRFLGGKDFALDTQAKLMARGGEATKLGRMAGSKAARNALRFVPCLLYTSPSPRDGLLSRMPSSA